jgi:amino acid transporter
MSTLSRQLNVDGVSASSTPSERHNEPPARLELPSEKIPEGWLMRTFRARDLTIMALFAVLLVTNVPVIAGAGNAAYLYWILGFLTFLIPSALICGQLYRLFPGEASVYLWANKAFGSFWDSFLGLFCNWWPGAFGLTIEAGAVVTSLQAINSNWLPLPWQQGLVAICVLIVAQGLCLLGRHRLQGLLNSAFIAYAVMFFLLGFAGVVWIISGHSFQGNASVASWHMNSGNYSVYATVIVSLLGMAVPLNLGAEILHKRAVSQYLVWGTVIIIVGYMFATFGVLAILPAKDIANPAFITEMFSLAFGPAIGGVLGTLNYVILVIYFICATAAFNLMFARLMMAAGIDRRLPSAMQSLNRQKTPVNAMWAQIIINIGFECIVFFIAPLIAPSNPGFFFTVYLVSINGLSVVWNIAMIGLFVCGILLCIRYRQRLVGIKILPLPLLCLAALLGCFGAGFAIYSTFFAGSPLPQALSNADWVYWVLLVVLGSLAIGAVYSFLVPESEDLVALLAPKKSPTRRANRSSLPTAEEIALLDQGSPVPFRFDPSAAPNGPGMNYGGKSTQSLPDGVFPS